MHPCLVLCVGLLNGCALLQPVEHPGLPAVDEGAGFSAPLPGTAAARTSEPAVWWRHAVEQDVSAALEDALAANPELALAEAGVVAARAQLRQAEAAGGPSLQLGAAANVDRTAGESTNDRLLSVDGDLAVDVSGAIAQRTTAARRVLQATLAEADQLESDLARDYLLALLDAAEAGQREALLGRQLEVAATLLRLIELRFTQGLAASIDVLQQRDQVAALRQQVPQARRDRRIAGNDMRRIANLAPGRELALAADLLPVIRGDFADVQPAQLLDRRGLLRAGRARVAAADARFAAALADRWPTLHLSASSATRFAAGDASTLISAALAAALALYDSGSMHAIAIERRAQLVASGQRYLADWIDTVISVDDLIIEEASLRERIDLSKQRLETAQALLTAAQGRYGRGVSDYLPVLEALRGLQQQQRDHLALQADLARARIRLHHALGQPAAEEQP